MALVSTPGYAQQNQTIKGTVVDQNGEPIIGATVKVVGQKGNNTGVITDIDGNYTLSIPKGSKVTISYIGYLPQTVTPGGKTQLKEDSQNLEEVVVVGYGTQKKAHLTGSIATVPMDEIQDISGAGLANALSGLMAGVSAGGGDARVGGSQQVMIRDASVLHDFTNKDTGPLYVIDGYVYPNDIKNLGEEAFNALNPSEVESISVLKDASAAVYGARAANGVVLVTTKKGKMGAPRISYNGTFGITDAVQLPKMLNSYDYGRLYNIMTDSDPRSTSLNRTTSLFQADELEAMKNLNYDLLDKYWKTGLTQQHSLNISGATEKVNYFAGIAYFTQDGNLGKLDYDRWNYRAGVDVKLSKNFKASLNVSGNYSELNKPNVKIGRGSGENDFRNLLYRPRYIPEYVNGLPIFAYGPSNAQANASQMYSYDLMQGNGDYNENKTNNMTINGSLEYDFDWSNIFKGLKLKLSYSKSINNDKGNEYGSNFTLYKMVNRTGSGQHLYTPIAGEEYSSYLTSDNFEPATYDNGNYLSRGMSRMDNYQINFTASYGRKFGLHDVSALFSIEKSESELEDLNGHAIDPYLFTNKQSTGAGGAKTGGWTRSESASLSYIGRLNYSYADKYLFEFLVRSDASTKFAKKNYWGVFPSASIGWVMSQEKWFSNALPWVDFLKLRGSFGLTGRDNTSAWLWMQHYGIWNKTSDNAVFGEGTTNTGESLRMDNNNADVNVDVHWDKSYKANIGLDFNVLNQRLAVTLEAYKVWNREMFMDMSSELPATIGTVSAAKNLGSMDNWGYEASFTWRDKIGKDFKYRVGVHFGYSDNKVLKSDFSNDYKYRTVQKGDRLDIGSWGMECIGMFRSYQEIQEYVKKYNITNYMGMAPDQIKPGMLIYKDVRGAGGVGDPDGVVNSNDDQVRLSYRASNPYGFTTNLNAEYKSFSISAQISASWGSRVTLLGKTLKAEYGAEATNMASFWDPDKVFVYKDITDGNGNVTVAENREGTLPNPAYTSVNSATSSFWTVSGTRVSLNRMTLAYKLPSAWMKAIGVQNARVNITGQNLLSFYNPYPNNFIDPMGGGYDSYPKLRKWTIGVNLTF